MRHFFLAVFSLCSLHLVAQKKAPKLVVGVVIDQMCYEYLYRYQENFSEGGFKKMMNEGTNCRNAQYNYVPTFTGPGHASIYTGTTPSNHGIVANDWYSRKEGKSVNCVEDNSVSSVGSTSKYGKFSPHRLKSNTVSDQLKLTYPEGKVISMSIKNRGAILPGGHLSDGSYWFDFSEGKFITSTFFQNKLPNWVKKFNALKYPEKALKMTWKTILPIKKYTQSDADNRPYEHLLGNKKTPTFPYDLKKMTNDSLDFGLFTYTPFCNTYLTNFALKSIENESLGEDNTTDMLCISYSTPDIAGHAFGPYSVEIQDMYLRLDLEIKRLIEALEEKVGKDEFVIFLTADHAVVPVPQFLVDKQLPGGYFYRDEFRISFQDIMKKKYGFIIPFELDNLNIYFDHHFIEKHNLKLSEVQREMANSIQSFDAIKRTFTGDQLYNGSNSEHWSKMISKGFHHAESGDIIIMLEAGYLPKSSDTPKAHKGTSHGSAYSYDTHVPLLFYGAEIPKQEIFRTIEITDIATTLVHIMNLQQPNAMTGKPIVEILR